jgi:ABC-2 type transport system permease protein
MFLEFLKMAGINLAFLGVLAALLVPLATYNRPAFAVLKRNFIGYFSNPTGYVFLFFFVLLTSIAAFWPHEFFVANLANLDQLSQYLPLIMLIFIPAITMSVWADERRQGTDELLLTLPATDFDIVIGKYLAAAAIFTCSLVYSQLCNYAVLVSLSGGDLDAGLLFTTYFGYWLIGLAMLAVGMVASFLTNNLTVSFVLGLVFNVPLALASRADAVIANSAVAQQVSRWSFAQQFDDFGRGIISLSGLTYFILIAIIGVYLSMVLIGSRHWVGGKDGQSLLGHYVVRGLSLVAILVGLNLLLFQHDRRLDTTRGRTSSLSAQTQKLLHELGSTKDKKGNPRPPVYIEAFLSRDVPGDYVKTKYTLRSMLKELQALAGKGIVVRIHDNLDAASDEVTNAEERFGIKPQVVRVNSRGVIKDEKLVLGVAFTCGLERVVIPFFDYGLQVEYELVRSIATVSKGERKKLGIVTTDAKLNGGMSFDGMQPRQTPKQLILDELEKQYKIEEVDPNQPIEVGKYDVLLVAQPSSLGPQPLSNVVEAVKRGQPTAIFEDPLPRMVPGVVGTAQPKMPQGGMFGMQQPPQPKGDIARLWKEIGIEPAGSTTGSKVIWQLYNPYPRLQLMGIGPEFVFIREETPGADHPFNMDDEVSSGLEELLFPFPGGIVSAGEKRKFEFTPLVSTSTENVGLQEWQDAMNSFSESALDKRGAMTNKKYVMAARVRGKEAAADAKDTKEKGEGEGEGEDKEAEKESKDKEKSGDKKSSDKAETAKGPKPVHVIYVADLDMLSSEFMMIRNRRDRFTEEIDFRMDNVTFVLNLIDSLAGDERFIAIRKRKPHFSTLQTIETVAKAARGNEIKASLQAQKDFNDAVADAEEAVKKASEKIDAQIAELKKKYDAGEAVDIGELRALEERRKILVETEQRKLAVKKEKLQQERDRKTERIQRDTEQKILKAQNNYKFWAAFLPPLPPLLVGLVVFLARRLREREGIAKTRLK